MRTRDLKENWSSKKTDKSMRRWNIIFIKTTFLPLFLHQVTKMLGNGRLEAMCFDGVKRLCHIRGKLRKKVWINQSDIILVGLRDYQVGHGGMSELSFTFLTFQDAKADVILKYSADEARNLKSYGEFPESIKITDTVDFVGGDLDDDIEFDDVDSDGSDSAGDHDEIDDI